MAERWPSHGTKMVHFTTEQAQHTGACHHPWASHYVITGMDYRKRRFTKNCGKNFMYALGHIVWEGNLWAVCAATGKRVHILRWRN